MVTVTARPGGQWLMQALSPCIGPSFRHKAITIGHGKFWQAGGIYLIIFANQLIQEKHIGGDGVVFVIGKALRRGIGHGAADIVEYNRRSRHLSRHDQCRGWGRAAWL